jgi:hypothetical protein
MHLELGGIQNSPDWFPVGTPCLLPLLIKQPNAGCFEVRNLQLIVLEKGPLFIVFQSCAPGVYNIEMNRPILFRDHCKQAGISATVQANFIFWSKLVD